MRHLAILVMLIAAAALVGCPAQQSPDASPLPGPGAALTTRASNASQEKQQRYVMLVRLGLLTIEVPVGTASGSEQIWSYLNEEGIGAERSANLGRNGFRIGTGRRENWNDLARILKRMTGRGLRESTVIATPENPIPIVLKQEQPLQTIFTFHEDRTLSGADYPAGDNLLALSCTFDQDDPTNVLVTGMPQIRTTYRQPQIVEEFGRLLMIEKPVIYGFGSMTFQLRMTNKDFLVIGPGAQSRRPNSIGHHFLVRDREGMDFETVLVLTPEIVANLIKDKGTTILGGMKKPD